MLCSLPLSDLRSNIFSAQQELYNSVAGLSGVKYFATYWGRFLIQSSRWAVLIQFQACCYINPFTWLWLLITLWRETTRNHAKTSFLSRDSRTCSLKRDHFFASRRQWCTLLYSACVQVGVLPSLYVTFKLDTKHASRIQPRLWDINVLPVILGYTVCRCSIMLIIRYNRKAKCRFPYDPD